jgi:hypothetical protein
MIDNCLTADIIDNEVEAEVADFVVLYSPVTSQEKVANFVSNGTFEIVPNEGYVLSKVTANVNVPIPNGYVKPSGSLDIKENGKRNVANYAEVNVNVQSEAPNIQPLTITENGTYTASGDVDGYSPITVNVGPSGGGDATIDDLMADTVVNVNLPTATKIHQYAFYQKKALESITMPNVTSIGTYAFYQCTKLGQLTWPDCLATIGDRAFMQCTALAISTLPSSLSVVNSNVFYGCKGITNLTIPANIVQILSNAFYTCTNLTEVTFKGTPISIMSNSFGANNNLKTINVPWAEGAVANAPWGASNATINYNYTGE